jgi:excisionase family DNA binding protein
MSVMSPEERAYMWRTADAHRGEERESLLHAIVDTMLAELRSDVDLYGDYQDAFVSSVDLLDHYGRFFDHSMLMAYQGLGLHSSAEEEERGEDSRRLLVVVSSRLGDLAADEDATAPDRRVAGGLSDLWRTRLLETEEEQYLTVAQLAARHGVTPQAVYQWIQKGKIDFEERPGGSYRIPAEQFRTSRATLEKRANTRRKLRELQGDEPMTIEEVVEALRSSRRDDDAD